MAWTKHQFDAYYLFENKKTKETVKVLTRDDCLPEDIQTRYCIASDYTFKGIFDITSNLLVSKTIRLPVSGQEEIVKEEQKEIIQPKIEEITNIS